MRSFGGFHLQFHRLHALLLFLHLLVLQLDLSRLCFHEFTELLKLVFKTGCRRLRRCICLR